jgi:hypothetical protein
MPLQRDAILSGCRVKDAVSRDECLNGWDVNDPADNLCLSRGAGNEHETLLKKSELGMQWFISQAIYDPVPMISLLKVGPDKCCSSTPRHRHSSENPVDLVKWKLMT